MTDAKLDERSTSTAENAAAGSAKCDECIYLVETCHHLTQEAIGYHCFSLGRQQDEPNDYNFNARQIKQERECAWFMPYETFVDEHEEELASAPKIDRFITIKVKWGY